MSTFPLTTGELADRLCIAARDWLVGSPIAFCFAGPDRTVWSSFRQDGTDAVSPALAAYKAFTALDWGRSTEDLGEMTGSTIGDVRAAGVRFIARPGGVVVIDGEGGTLGAIGISAVNGEGEHALAVAIIRSVMHELVDDAEWWDGEARREIDRRYALPGG